MPPVAQWFSRTGQRFPARLRPPSHAAVAWRCELEKTLHDDVAIGLAALALRLGKIADSPDDKENQDGQGGQDGHGGELRAARTLLRRILDDVRRIGVGIYPPVLTVAEFEPALRSVAERRDLRLSLDLPRHGLAPEVRSRTGLLVVDHLESLSPGTSVIVRVRGRKLVRVRITEEPTSREQRRAHWAVLRCE